MTDNVLEPTSPVPPARPRRAMAVAAVALVAVLAGGLAVATSGDEPEPLALVAGSGGAAQDERASLASGAPAPAVAPMADSKMAIGAPYWGGFEYRVEGDLPDLGDRATAWRVIGPDVDRETVTRWARALGLSGSPEQSDGGWTIALQDGYFSVYPGDGWSLSYNRNPGARNSGAVSAEAAERRARDVLESLGVLDGEWRVQVFESEIGIGYACAEDLKLRAEEMARTDPDGTVSNASGISSGPAPSTAAPSMPDCPPPPPPVKAQNVSFFPVVGDMRTEWPVWNVTVSADGIEGLYGSWVRFERGDEYKLRSVDAALDELRQGGRVMPVAEPMPDAMPMPMPADAAPPGEPATDSGTAVSSGGGTSGWSGSAGSPATVVEDPAAPVASGVASARPAIAPYSPCPPEADCAAPQPQVVTITNVELVLQPQGLWSGREQAPQMILVPAYRFTGTFQDGSAWESSVVALHPDAIAPPPVIDDVAPAKGMESGTLPMETPAKPPAG